MRKATLVRDYALDTSQGTFGVWRSDSGFSCYILERPATGDHPCIPVGTYMVQMKPHPIHKKAYELQNVPGRTAILIHSANWFEQLLGCLAPGRSIQLMSGFYKDDAGNSMPVNHLGVTSSVDALNSLIDDLSCETFSLCISQAPPPPTATEED